MITSVTPSLIPGSDGTRVTIHYAGTSTAAGRSGSTAPTCPAAPAGQELPDPVEGPQAIWDGKINGSARAGGHVPGRARRDRRRLRHRLLPGTPSAGAREHRARWRDDQLPRRPSRRSIRSRRVPTRSSTCAPRGLPIAGRSKGERAHARRLSRASPTRRRCPSTFPPGGRGCTSSRSGRPPVSTTVPIVAAAATTGPRPGGAPGADLAGTQSR